METPYQPQRPYNSVYIVLQHRSTIYKHGRCISLARTVEHQKPLSRSKSQLTQLQQFKNKPCTWYKRFFFKTNTRKKNHLLRREEPSLRAGLSRPRRRGVLVQTRVQPALFHHRKNALGPHQLPHIHHILEWGGGSKAKQSQVRQARQGKARQGKARQGKAR